MQYNKYNIIYTLWQYIYQWYDREKYEWISKYYLSFLSVIILNAFFEFLSLVFLLFLYLRELFIVHFFLSWFFRWISFGSFYHMPCQSFFLIHTYNRFGVVRCCRFNCLRHMSVSQSFKFSIFFLNGHFIFSQTFEYLHICKSEECLWTSIRCRNKKKKFLKRSVDDKITTPQSNVICLYLYI